MKIVTMPVNKERLDLLQSICDAFYLKISHLPINKPCCQLFPLETGDTCRVVASGYLIEDDGITIYTVMHEQTFNIKRLASIRRDIDIFSAMFEKKVNKVMVH